MWDYLYRTYKGLWDLSIDGGGAPKTNGVGGNPSNGEKKKTRVNIKKNGSKAPRCTIIYLLVTNFKLFILQ